MHKPDKVFCFLNYVLTLIFWTYVCVGGSALHADKITIPLNAWCAIVDPLGLKIDGVLKKKVYLLSAPDLTYFGVPQNIERHKNGWRVAYPQKGLVVYLRPFGNRLHITVTSSQSLNLTWPLLHIMPKAYLFPEGEGLYLPTGDSFWMSYLKDNTFDTQSTVLPFVGLLFKKATLTLIVHTPLRNAIIFKGEGGETYYTITHHFLKSDRKPTYEVSFALSKPDILAPAKVYKRFLKDKKRYLTLKSKTQRSPDIQKLAGAIHIYLWGDGRSFPMLVWLKKLGIKNAWLGYEERPPYPVINPCGPVTNHYVNEVFINQAKNQGYLIGPYDSWHTMEAPAKAGCHNTDFGNFYPQGCVRDLKGNIVPGFAGRGCSVSMKALSQTVPPPSLAYKRFNAFKQKGINTYFLDCHATGEVFDDPHHQQTVWDDLELRKTHLNYLAQSGLVVGSETAAAWSIPYLAFAHGNFSTAYELHWPFYRNNRKLYGGWWPHHKPGIFFNCLPATDTYKKRYDPRFRIPLFQAVFHEACVSTDRWDIPLTKFPNLMVTRFLLECAFGVPPMLSLDMQSAQKYSSLLQDLARMWAPLHRRIMNKPLTGFRWLNKERTACETLFGKSIRIRTNFSRTPCGALLPQCAHAKDERTGWKTTLRIKNLPQKP
jgi:hypothetical protein